MLIVYVGVTIYHSIALTLCSEKYEKCCLHLCARLFCVVVAVVVMHAIAL